MYIMNCLKVLFFTTTIFVSCILFCPTIALGQPNKNEIDSAFSDKNSLKYQHYSVEEVQLSDKITLSDVINNIDRHIMILGIIVTLIVSVFAFFYGYNLTTLKKDLNKKTKKFEEQIDTITNQTTNEALTRLIKLQLSDALLQEVLIDVLNSKYKQEIFNYTIAYNREVLGLSQNKRQAVEMLFRTFFTGILHSSSNKGRFDKVKLKDSFDKFFTDWFIVERLYSGDIDQISRALTDYCVLSKNKQLLETLTDLSKRYKSSENANIYLLFVNALGIAKA